MKRVIVLALGLVLFSACGMKKGNFLKTHTSKYEITKTATLFAKALKEKGYTISDQIDHSKIAEKENIYLQPTLTLTLYNPKVSSALLTCNQSMAMEMPIKIAIYSELGGEVKLAYTDPEYWSLKHNIKDKNCLNVIVKIAQNLDIASAEIDK